MLHVLFDQTYCRSNYGGVLCTDMHVDELTKKAAIDR
jgi:hypothetical protein